MKSRTEIIYLCSGNHKKNAEKKNGFESHLEEARVKRYLVGESYLKRPLDLVLYRGQGRGKK